MFFLTSFLVKPMHYLYFDQERKVYHEGYIKGNFSLRVEGLEAVRSLIRLLTILSNIQVMSDESYNCYLTISRQITLQERNWLFFYIIILFSLRNILFLLDLSSLNGPTSIVNEISLIGKMPILKKRLKSNSFR